MSFTGYTTATLGLTPTAAGTTYYKCVVSNECDGDPVTSNVVTVNAATAYTLTWNLNGGKVTTAGTGAAVDATGTPSIALAAGAAITTPIVAKDYHAFNAWSSTPASTMPAGNTTYTASWTPLYAFGTYMFDGNSSLGTLPNNATCGTGTTSAFRIDNIFFSGSTFEYEEESGTGYGGWKWKSDGTISFMVENDCDVTVGLGTFGSGGGATISYTNTSGVQQNSISLSASTDNTYSVKGGTVVTIAKSGTKNKTVTLKKIAITASCTSITPTLSYASVGGTTLAVGGSSSGSPTVSGNSGSGAVTYSVTAADPAGSATVHSSTGVVTGVHVGTATVTASVAESGGYCAGSATASFTITCAPITPTFSTDYSSTSLNVGANSSTPAIDKDGSSGAITWTSSDEDVATVNGSGVVTAKAVGTTSITATVAENGDYCEGSVSKSFTVSCATPTISVNPASAAYCKDGAATALSFTGSGHNAQKWQKSTDGGSNYSDISGATSATYTPPTGTAGTTLYRVVTTCNNYASNTQTSAAATVTVKAPLSLSLSYTSTTLTEGDDSSSPTLSGNSGSGAVTYSVTAASPSGSATVDLGTGVVSAVKAGTATVTASVAATASYCAGSTTANFTINSSCDDSELSVSMD